MAPSWAWRVPTIHFSALWEDIVDALLPEKVLRDQKHKGTQKEHTGTKYIRNQRGTPCTQDALYFPKCPD